MLMLMSGLIFGALSIFTLFIYYGPHSNETGCGKT
jgi:hypothetical protein